jgi:uncharacterized membrane protein YGL010W
VKENSGWAPYKTRKIMKFHKRHENSCKNLHYIKQESLVLVICFDIITDLLAVSEMNNGNWFTRSSTDILKEFGIYAAYHQTVGNRAVHWVTTCIGLLSLLSAFSSIYLVGFIPLGLILGSPLIIYFIATGDVIVVGLMFGWLLTLNWVGSQLFITVPFTSLWIAIGVLAFVVQVLVGHRVYEGRDNFANAAQGAVAFAYFGPTLEGGFFKLFPRKYQLLLKSKQAESEKFQKNK